MPCPFPFPFSPSAWFFFCCCWCADGASGRLPLFNSAIRQVLQRRDDSEALNCDCACLPRPLRWLLVYNGCHGLVVANWTGLVDAVWFPLFPFPWPATCQPPSLGTWPLPPGQLWPFHEAQWLWPFPFTWPFPFPCPLPPIFPFCPLAIHHGSCFPPPRCHHGRPS